MLASSPMISTSGSDQTRGTRTISRSASPGPTSVTSVSVVNGPPLVLKYITNTSASVPSERGAFIVLSSPVASLRAGAGASRHRAAQLAGARLGSDARHQEPRFRKFLREVFPHEQVVNRVAHLEAGGNVQIRQLDGDLALGRLRFLIVAQHLHLGFGAGQERVRLRRHAGCIRTKPESGYPHLGPHSEHGRGAKLSELHRVRDALVRDLTIAEALQVHHPKVIAPELQPLKIRLRDRSVRDHAPQR